MSEKTAKPESAATGENGTARLEAFSDGVFAIAITLLALELKVPHLEGDQLTAASLSHALLAEWPHWFSLITSFFTVLIMWVHHHMIFKLVRCSDPTLLFANGLLLLIITVVPFPTAVVAEYLETPAASAACALYSGVFVLIALSFYLVIWAAFRPEVLDPKASPATVARLRRDYRFGPPLYVIATLAAPISPALSMTICTALWIFWGLSTREC